MGLFSSNEGRSKRKTGQPDPQQTPVKRDTKQTWKNSNLSNSKQLKQPFTYPYTPLDPELGEIRVLKIIPGRDNEPLICTLHHTSLLTNTLRYETTSYCCGTSPAEELITIDGRKVAVRCSAANVLRRMRLPDVGRFVWIDAICIHQSSLSEKNSQVALMHQIYSRTDRNLIWLGDDKGSATEVKATLEAVLQNAFARTNGFRDFWQLVYPGRIAAGNGTLLDRNIELAPLTKFFSADWFSRVWVVQEAVLARKSICFFGSAQFILEDVLRVATWLSFNRLLVPTSLKDIEGLKRARNIWKFVDHQLVPKQDFQLGRRDLHYLYTMTKEFEASEPRDKIYGLLGMFQSGKPIGLAPPSPDYQKPLLEVFREATRFMIENSASLSVLEHNMAVRRFRDASCPSWVVDFARDRNCDCETRPFAMFSADHGERLRLASPPSSANRLTLIGIKTGVVLQRTLPFNEHDVQGYIGSAEKLGMKRAMVKGCGLHDALAITLIAGTNSRDLPATKEDVTDFETLLCYLQKYSRTPPTRPDLNVLNAVKLDRSTYLASRYWSALETTSRGRCFFVTANGQIGLGPSRMDEKDIVAILYGARSPVILRPSTGAYKFVGKCYLHGVMQGEAVREHRARGAPDETFEIA